MTRGTQTIMHRIVAAFYLLCIWLSCSRGVHHQLRFLQPGRACQIVGGVTHVSVLVQSFDGEMIINNGSTTVLEFVLVINDRVVHQASAQNSLFECVLLDSALKAGWNNLLMQLRTNNGVVVATDKVIVFKSELHGVLVGSSTDGRSNEHRRGGTSAVLMVGIGVDTIARLARLDPLTLTVLDAAGSDACEVLGSPKFVRCASPQNPWDALRSPAYDRAIISHAGLRAIADAAGMVNTSSFLSAFVQRVVGLTHGEIWFWTPETESVHPDALLGADVCDTTSPCFERVHVQGARSDSDQVPREDCGTMEELLSVTAEEDLARTGNLLYRLHSETYHRRVRVQSHDAGADFSSEAPMGYNQLSTIERADWSVGRVQVHLKNVCLLRDGRTLVVTAADSRRSEWEDLWDKAASSEDFGFQYTSLLLRKISPSGQTDAINYLQHNVTWMTGLTALPLSAQGGHIVHQIEALLQLLADAESAGSCTAPSPNELQSVIFPLLSTGQMNDWVASVVALILRYREKRWAGCSFNATEVPEVGDRVPRVFLRDHLFPEAPEANPTAFYILRPVPEGRTLQRDVPLEDLHGAVCYRDLLLLGRTNTHVKFFPTSRSAAEFRNFVHHELGVRDSSRISSKRATTSSNLPSEGHRSSWERLVATHFKAKAEDAPKLIQDRDGSMAGQPGLRCAPGSLSCSIHTFPSSEVVLAPLSGAWFSDAGQSVSTPVGGAHRRLRVTISIRTGGRYILNLPDLLRRMLETGLVDKAWLLGHVVVLETMPFEAQVRLMADTDVFICVHGAAVINGIFMHRGSVVIELFNARFVEFVFAPPLRESDVLLLYTYPRNQAKDTRHCPDSIPARCLSPNISVHDAGSVECVAIRTCSVIVDVEDFELKFMEAYYHVLGDKWHRAEAVNDAVFLKEAVDGDGGRVDGGDGEVAMVAAMRSNYLHLAYHKQFTEALTTALTLRSVSRWKDMPVYLLELGVLSFSGGQYTAGYDHCTQARHEAERLGRDAVERELLVQIHMCLGVTGAYLPDPAVADIVISSISSALRIATEESEDRKSIPASQSTQGDDEFQGARRSTMLAAPVDSIIYNLLRAMERYGRFGECVTWFATHTHLPDIHRGGVHIIAFSAVKWSESNKKRIDALEARLRASGGFDLTHNESMWGAIQRVQDIAFPLISLSNLCLNKLQTCAAGDRACSAGHDVDMQVVWQSLYAIAVQTSAQTCSPLTPAGGSAGTAAGGTGAPPDPPVSQGAALVTQYYLHSDSAKMAGIDFVLQRNLNNPHIAEVYLLNEKEYDFSGFGNSDKIYQFVTGKRLSFKDAFLFANQYLAGRVVALANSDIFFDDTLSAVLEACGGDASPPAGQPGDTRRRSVLALLKWQADKSDPAALPHLSIRTDSQDAWIFRSPLPDSVAAAADFFLGQPKCDNRLVHIFQQAGYNVTNPVFSVRAIEYPYEFAVPVYDAQQSVSGEVSDLLLADTVDF